MLIKKRKINNWNSRESVLWIQHFTGDQFFKGLHFICLELTFIRVFFYKTNLKLLSRSNRNDFPLVSEHSPSFSKWFFCNLMCISAIGRCINFLNILYYFLQLLLLMAFYNIPAFFWWFPVVAYIMMFSLLQLLSLMIIWTSYMDIFF